MTTEIPRLSPSIAKILLDKSPKHAWDAHRLLAGNKPKSTSSKDLGSAIDHLVFGTPLKEGQKFTNGMLKKAEPVAEAAKKALQERGITGIAQHRIEWNYDGIDCSGVVDLWCPNQWMFYDLKTINDGSDFNIEKQIDTYGYDLQYAAYAQGLWLSNPMALGEPIGQYLFIETSSPYDVRFVPFKNSVIRSGAIKWQRAQNRWRECMRTNQWPGRGDFTADVSPYRKRELADNWIDQ